MERRGSMKLSKEQCKIDGFKERLYDLLKKNGLTQKKLAEMVGVTEATVSRYCREERVPNAYMLAKIAASLHTTTDYLLGRGVGEEAKAMKKVCKACEYRQMYAKCFDHHFSGADCIFECPYADDNAENDVEVTSEPTSSEVHEKVNHPDHYQGKHECIDEMVALFGVEDVKAFCRCNVYKYRFRAGKKNGEEDIRKAEWYMDKLMELEGMEDD